MENKPRLFIGCSKERLKIAHAMKQNLEESDDINATVWQQGTFEPSKTPLESLIKALDEYNTAAFLFTPDDAIKIKENTEQMTARDNVIFELGLFMGKLGREKCFIVSPKGVDMHLPTDLNGMTLITYDSKQLEEKPQSALGTACYQITQALNQRIPRIIINSDRCSYIERKLTIEGTAYGGQYAVIFWASNRSNNPEENRYWCIQKPLPIIDNKWKISTPLKSPAPFRNVIAALCNQDEEAWHIITEMNGKVLTTKDDLKKNFNSNIIWSEQVRIDKKE